MTSRCVHISLTGSEFMQAAMVGVMRQIQNRRAGRQDAHGCDPENGWSPHIEGACGEFAVAKVLGLFWSGNLGRLTADDVGELQVRTRSRHDYDLIVHPDDPDKRAFVLVTGRAPDFRIWGWISGQDAKRPEWWGEKGQPGRPAFFVPQSALHGLRDLHHPTRLRPVHLAATEMARPPPA